MTDTTLQRTKCEIWTRVMGYHRPVSQYNHGKKSEFYSRVYFKSLDEENAELIRKYGGIATKASEENPKLLLFTTNTCPKCPAVKSWMQNSGMEYFSIDNTMLNFWELAQKYDIHSVPTLVALDSNGQLIWKGHEISQIQQQLNNQCL